MGIITCKDIPGIGDVHLVRLIDRGEPFDRSLIPCKNTVVVIGMEHEGQAAIEVTCTPDLERKVHAGRIIEAIVGHIGGHGGGLGGGRAQGGGNDPAGLPRALRAARGALMAQLGVE